MKSPSRLTKTTARILVKTVLLALALAFGMGGILRRVHMLGLSPELLFYAGLYGGLALCLWCAAFIRQGWLRWSWALFFAVAAIFVGSFQTATADAMSYDAFVTMIHSAGFAGDAMAQHGASLAWAAVGGFMLFLALVIRPARLPFLPGTVAVIAPFAGLAILSLLLFVRGGEGARGLPGAWVGTAYSALYAYEATAHPSRPRQAVGIDLVRKSGPNIQGDIVLIIDESIAGRYLDINDASGVRSGLATPPPGVTVSNFGIAASITHCSYGSNLTLRYGGTRGDYRQMNTALPSIFAYAHKAGYRTVYIDAQREGGDYQNGMDDAERRTIDQFIQFENTAIINRDMAAADSLIAMLGNGQREFILVNKMGAHFPVADKYPDDGQIYQPALPRGESTLVTDMRFPKNLYNGAQSWRLYRNAYRNTVAWTVGRFFDRIFAHAPLNHALIIYTSDHGQNLHESGDSGATTHCSPTPMNEEGAVPLVIIDSSGRWQQAAKRHFDASSHYRIFPTLLGAMGYDKTAVRRIYGEALDSLQPDPATFNGLFHARLGRDPAWVKVDRASIAQPPQADYIRKAEPLLADTSTPSPALKDRTNSDGR